MNSNSFMRVRVQKKYFFEFVFGENDRIQRVRVRSPDYDISAGLMQLINRNNISVSLMDHLMLFKDSQYRVRV